MTHDYKFEVGYTKLGTASAPSVTPTVNIINMDTDALLVTGGAATAMAAMPGVYKYTHTDTAGLNLRALFHTTDVSMDQQDLYSIDMNASVVVGSGITVGAGARTTMADIIAELRMMASAGTADYSIAGADFWSDSQLQDILDRNAWTMDAQTLAPSPKYISGGYEYTDYFVGRGWLEQSNGGTAIFYLQDLSGNIIPSTDYSADYSIGQVTFDVDTGGDAYLVSCVSYDMNAAAAQVWRKKANYYFSAVDFSTDNHSIKRESVYLHCIQQAQRFEALSWGASDSVDLVRADDLVTNWDTDDILNG